MKNALMKQDGETQLEVYGSELHEGVKVSALLKASMNRKAKKIFFNNKEYAEFHDLQVVANYFGHSIRTHDAQPIDIGGIKGFKAHADLINKDGIAIGGAEAYCLQDEPNWARKPLFQLASMAQTRAASKCITNVYRWVLDLSGYGTTPAEEMPTEATEPLKPAPKVLEAQSWPHPGDVNQDPGFISDTISIVDVKDFTSKKGTQYIRVYDNKTNAYLAFDKKMIDLAKSLVGCDALISYEKSKFGNTLKTLTAL